MKIRNLVVGAFMVGSLLLPSATVFARGEPEPGDDHGRHGGGHGRTILLVPTVQRGEPEPGDDHGNHGGGHR
ncbi:MAG: hypothetical protein U0350_28485 [Caldilineaceae bacterium]